MLTLLTATGMRPEAWSICEQLMMAQTYDGPVRWIVVDDGEKPQPITFRRDNWRIELIYPEPAWQPGQNTQARNLAAGLAHVRFEEWLVIIEDDDFYHPDYLKHIDTWLHRGDLVGEQMARYFNVATGSGKELQNQSHCSLCSTAVKGAGIEALRQAVAKNKKFIDLELWRTFKGKKYLSNSRLVVGIKGLPGREGIGCGHRMTGGASTVGLLRQWIGDDAGIYGY